MKQLARYVSATLALLLGSACIRSTQSVLLSYQICHAIELSTCKPVYGLLGHGPTLAYTYNDCLATGLLLSGPGPVFSGEQIRLYEPSPRWRDGNYSGSRPSEFTGTVALNTSRGLARIALTQPDGKPFKYNGTHHFSKTQSSNAEGPCPIPATQN